jgi:hypothetical protein
VYASAISLWRWVGLLLDLAARGAIIQIKLRSKLCVLPELF